ncbi:MAG: saccharopine dehydrogenase NADP-binding domain-containing protein [Archangium sp.]|nr:saccharopine dehydrogenase NADP-binding domain-containing protein [Archangium sp.]
MAEATFDVVVFGATSFVGQILCRVLMEQKSVRWAIAGRARSKLEALQRTLGVNPPPILIADASDAAALRAMCEQTRVVISTVGPYALYGGPLVHVCAETGTDYCDLTGEPQWIREMLDRHEATAQKSGARIVHCCGFDSLPSDLGVHFVQRLAHERFGQPCVRVEARVKTLKGGASGGTIASMLHLVKEASTNPALMRALMDPYLLCPPPPNRGDVAQHDIFVPTRDAARGDAWLAPFVMATINTRVVHRTHALSGLKYGRDFRYDEAMVMGRGVAGWLRAMGFTAGLGALLTAAAVPPLRWALERFVLPKPGEGPSPEAQARGTFDIRFHGTTADGRSVSAKVTGDRDPGYGSTAKMLAQAGLCLANDVEALPGGFWTPVTAMGDALIARLQREAGLSFEAL